jgi:hypothetical protein
MRVDGITEIGQRLEWPPPIHVCGGNELPAAMRVDGITEIRQRRHCRSRNLGRKQICKQRHHHPTSHGRARSAGERRRAAASGGEWRRAAASAGFSLI